METEILNTPLPLCNNTGMCHSKETCEYCIAEPWGGFCACAAGRRKEHSCTVLDSFQELLVQQSSFESLGFESL